MQELKPVAWMRPNGTHVDHHKHDSYLPLYALPATHRIVPVELLHAIEIDLTTECTNFDTLNKLRAIIEGQS
jgi:fatty acid desaturase